MARPGKARPGEARNWARLGSARRGIARLGVAWNPARHGVARLGVARPGTAGQGKDLGLELKKRGGMIKMEIIGTASPEFWVVSFTLITLMIIIWLCRRRRRSPTAVS